MSLHLLKVSGQVMVELDSTILLKKKKKKKEGAVCHFLATQQLNPLAYVLKMPSFSEPYPSSHHLNAH